MTNPQIIKDFEQLFEKNLKEILIPYQKGDGIRVGEYDVIAAPKQGSFKVKHSKSSTVEYESFSKSAAMAYAVCLTKKLNYLKRIKELDSVLEKHYLDTIFYKNVLNGKCGTDTKDALRTRLEMSNREIKRNKSKLERIIFSNITK